MPAKIIDKRRSRKVKVVVASSALTAAAAPRAKKRSGSAGSAGSKKSGGGGSGKPRGCFVRACAPPPVGTGGSSKAGVVSRMLAEKVLERVKKEEPTITNDISSVVEAGGGYMQSLDKRLKGVSSLTRKIHDKALLKEISLSKSAYLIADAVRYTGIIPPEAFSDTVSKTIAMLQDQGYKVSEVENYWPRGDDYNGLHLLATSRGGVTAELQFHTAESYDIKEYRNHPEYVIYRDPHTPDARRRELFDSMTRRADSATMPPGILDIPLLKVKPFTPNKRG